MVGAQMYADSDGNYNIVQRMFRAGAVGAETALIESGSDWVGLVGAAVAGKPGFVAASFATDVTLDMGADWINNYVIFSIIGGGNKR